MNKTTAPLHSVDFYEWNVLTQFKLRGDMFTDPVLKRVTSYFTEGVTYLLNGGYVYKARGSGSWMVLPKAEADTSDKPALMEKTPSPNRDYPKELLELIISDADSASSLEDCKIVGRDPSSWAPEHRSLLEKATESNSDLGVVAEFLAIGGSYAKKDNYLFRVDSGVDRMVVPRGDVRDTLIRECLEGMEEGENPVERVQRMISHHYMIPHLESEVTRVMDACQGLSSPAVEVVAEDSSLAVPLTTDTPVTPSL